MSELLPLPNHAIATHGVIPPSRGHYPRGFLGTEKKTKKPVHLTISKSYGCLLF